MRNIIIRVVCALIIASSVSYAVATNYSVTQGSGTTFGSIVVAGVNYAQQFICDATTPSQCAAVSSGGAIKVTASERWIAGSGQGLSWGSAFGTELQSLVNGDAIISTVSIANGTGLDTYADISLSLGSITSGSGSPYIGIYLYPLNQDGSTYGDGRFATATAATPPTQYFACSIPVVASTTAAIVGQCTGVVIPPGTFEFVLFNLAGATLAGSADTVKYRTYNKSLQ